MLQPHGKAAVMDATAWAVNPLPSAYLHLDIVKASALHDAAVLRDSTSSSSGIRQSFDQGMHGERLCCSHRSAVAHHAKWTKPMLPSSHSRHGAAR